MIYASGRVLCISVQRASAFFFFFFLASHPGVAGSTDDERERETITGPWKKKKGMGEEP